MTSKENASPSIQINNLTKRFRSFEALTNVSFQVEQGEIFSLMGPNGAGKTTLVKILCSLILPDSGTFEINGRFNLVLGEERSFYPRLTGRQNLEFFASLYGLSPSAARKKISSFAHLLAETSLDKKFQEYSTGTKHRLSLIRAMLNDSQIIFMDEPTRSMDPSGAAKFREEIRILRDQFRKTIFITTHQCQEAEAVADKIAILNHGQIKGIGSLDELRRQTKIPMGSLMEIFRNLTEQEPHVSD